MNPALTLSISDRYRSPIPMPPRSRRKPAPAPASEAEVAFHQKKDWLLYWSLTQLMTMEANGLEKPAAELVDKIAVGLARKPKRDAAELAKEIELPANERGLSPKEVARFDKARAELLSPTLPLTDAQRKERARTLAAIEANRRTDAEKAWRKQAMAETVALAKARGEDVEIPKEDEPATVRSRDGLHSLALQNRLTLEEYTAAMGFRAAYDVRTNDVGSQMGAESSGGAHDNGKYVANRFVRAKALQNLGAAERKIAVECRDEPACLQMFRAVIGEGISLSSFGEGRAFDRHLAALRRGLGTVMGCAS